MKSLIVAMLACSTVAFAQDAATAKAELKDAKGAIVVEEEECAFAEAVLRVLRSRDLRAQLSAVAPGDAKAWSATGMAQRLLQFYASLVRGSPL